MSSTLSIILNAVGWSLGLFLLARYRFWKANRREIPMELQNGVWVPDGKLKRWERRAKWSLWIGLAICFVLAYLFITNLDMSAIPQK